VTSVCPLDYKDLIVDPNCSATNPASFEKQVTKAVDNLLGCQLYSMFVVGLSMTMLSRDHR